MKKRIGHLHTSKNDLCYLDANFLIAYFAPNHPDHRPARQRMFELFVEKKMMLISCLALDETFFKVKEVVEFSVPNDRKSSFAEFSSILRHIVDEIEKIRLIRIVQFRKNLVSAVRDALDNMRLYNFRPRDAFHLACMRDFSIGKIVTKDKDFFKKVPGIEVISY